MAEPTNTKKRVINPGYHKGSIDMHQRRQGELPKGSDAQTSSVRDCGTTMREGTQEMNLSQVDNDNRGTIKPMKVDRDNEDTYKNYDFMKEDHTLIKNAAKKPGAGK